MLWVLIFYFWQRKKNLGMFLLKAHDAAQAIVTALSNKKTTNKELACVVSTSCPMRNSTGMQGFAVCVWCSKVILHTPPIVVGDPGHDDGDRCKGRCNRSKGCVHNN